ncbi:MAG: LPS export ABC transporter periplasmic protein LptC, partial [Verrucomicrobiota bacterium]
TCKGQASDRDRERLDRLLISGAERVPFGGYRVQPRHRAPQRTDLVIGELTSKTPARIEQPKFVMTGDKMIFDTRTQVSRLIGNVRVVVPDASGFAAGAGFSLPGGR